MHSDPITADFTDFIEQSPSVYHVVRNIQERLLAAGFEPLDERSAHWDLIPGRKYFVTRNSSSIISFRLPHGGVSGLHITASHSDSPTFRVKPDPEIESAGCVKLNIEPYGGMLKSTWYDRPLTVAGRIFTEDNGAIRQHLVYVDRDLLIIPSLAIHMDRKANETLASNVQNDMLPLFAPGRKQGDFMRIVTEAAGASGSVLGADLFLATRDKPVIWGPDDAYISSPRLDDLMCCYGTLTGFLEAVKTNECCDPDGHGSTCEADSPSSRGILAMHCVFDNEEVGSRTKQGAESTFLTDTLDRIRESLGLRASDLRAAAAAGMMISADNAHAVHPNHVDKADPVNRPAINGGIVLKFHAGQKYTTDGVSEAYLRSLCGRHDIPLQIFVNRSDMAGGSTLGNIANTHLSLNTADIGLAQLAMHSSFETAGTKDLGYLSELSRAFYGEPLPAFYAE